MKAQGVKTGQYAKFFVPVPIDDTVQPLDRDVIRERIRGGQ